VIIAAHFDDEVCCQENQTWSEVRRTFGFKGHHNARLPIAGLVLKRWAQLSSNLNRRFYLAVPHTCRSRICLECHRRGIPLWHAK
jgi:hypothetical protein